MNRWTASKGLKGAITIVLSCLALYILLLIPESVASPPEPAAHQPFQWNQNERWLALEQKFRDARAVGCSGLRGAIDEGIRHGGRMLAEIAARPVDPTHPILDSIENHTFELGTMVGGCVNRLPEYIDFVTRMRSLMKRQSEHWDMNIGKDRLYRLLWGGRAALEEVMLQGPTHAVSPLVLADSEPSHTPFTRILGATIHSGDLLVSRGGAPTSALIAVGNDFPGNFSHVAVVHVDETTSLPTVIQSSEHGLHLSSLEAYFEDVKLRVMILRLRADLPSILADPMLPHTAATRALERAQSGHTPYDFGIDHGDDSKMYCSEVPAWAYRQVGVQLWMAISRVSAPGTRQWLADLGVERFDMQEPSDLEYDSQLRVVAEWRDPHTLYLDHVDNVVTEALLNGAARGDRLTHVWYVLPFVRALKGYSVLLNLLGRSGPIPEGLSATLAARVLALNNRHAAVKRRVLELATEFQDREGYRPPEWQLLHFARLARDEPQ
jgi:hypothetical protein